MNKSYYSSQYKITQIWFVFWCGIQYTVTMGYRMVSSAAMLLHF